MHIGDGVWGLETGKDIKDGLPGAFGMGNEKR